MVNESYSKRCADMTQSLLIIASTTTATALVSIYDKIRSIRPQLIDLRRPIGACPHRPLNRLDELPIRKPTAE